MRRAVASSMTWWVRLFVVSLLAVIVLDLPAWAFLLPPAFYAVSLVRPPPPQDPEPRWLSAPVRGRWVGLNSPADKVPSHGVRAYGQAYAIDILHPEPGDAPRSLGWSHGLREPETFSCFGEPVYAVAPGTVVRATDRLRDQRSRSSWPAVIWMLVVEGLLRELAGARFILGNHLVLDHGDGTFTAYAHLRRGSIRVSRGDRVEAGQELAAVGNTGNTSEPHLHVQLMDRARVTAAAGLPFRWRGIDVEAGTGSAAQDDDAVEVVDGLPAAGQTFTAAPPPGR
ncbi:M23 family metallopeptidase [uncultured Serinicoccus sp.]|uniref:M23 family metallopeptidase n=1 Tax=uncultured Serinicoccus sp. TaxID=735514 RepID=UPI00262911A0|nr:M23 family metallopeptidase [uncultured Serinicoccus sp.]